LLAVGVAAVALGVHLFIAGYGHTKDCVPLSQLTSPARRIHAACSALRPASESVAKTDFFKTIWGFNLLLIAFIAAMAVAFGVGRAKNINRFIRACIGVIGFGPILLYLTLFGIKLEFRIPEPGINVGAAIFRISDYQDDRIRLATGLNKLFPPGTPRKLVERVLAPQTTAAQDAVGRMVYTHGPASFAGCLMAERQPPLWAITVAYDAADAVSSISVLRED
jgi:hypothetical protein